MVRAEDEVITCVEVDIEVIWCVVLEQDAVAEVWCLLLLVLVSVVVLVALVCRLKVDFGLKVAGVPFGVILYDGLTVGEVVRHLAAFERFVKLIILID